MFGTERMARPFIIHLLLPAVVIFIFAVVDGATARGLEPKILAMDRDSYMKEREVAMKTEESSFTGSDVVLTDKEEKVNAILMKSKVADIDEGIKTETFPPALNFISTKGKIEQSDVFKIIKKMPKGGVLHLHSTAMTDIAWLIKNATYDPNCYMCFDGNGDVMFHYFNQPPVQPTPICEWIPVNDARINFGNAEEFDKMLYKNMTMIVDDPESAYKDQNAVWTRFLKLFSISGGLIRYVPTFMNYIYGGLQELYDDNVQYAELRLHLQKFYELNGTTHDRAWVLAAHERAVNRFILDHPDFLGVKIIYCSTRNSDAIVVGEEIQEAIEFRRTYPNFVAGYDLVAQEDSGHPLIYYIDQLLIPQQMNPPVSLPFFFHAGETDWEGTYVDNNLIDAVLLNASRIGHGFASTKHPLVMQQLQDKKIAVELNPISNQVLKLVDDLRNHPAAILLANHIPAVVCSDDPAFWGASGLSYDFYEIFMASSPEKADLALLKKLAMDSIKYSAMNDTEKTNAYTVWSKKWDLFLDDVLSMDLKIKDRFKDLTRDEDDTDTSSCKHDRFLNYYYYGVDKNNEIWPEGDFFTDNNVMEIAPPPLL